MREGSRKRAFFGFFVALTSACARSFFRFFRHLHACAWDCPKAGQGSSESRPESSEPPHDHRMPWPPGASSHPKSFSGRGVSGLVFVPLLGSSPDDVKPARAGDRVGAPVSEVGNSHGELASKSGGVPWTLQPREGASAGRCGLAGALSGRRCALVGLGGRGEAGSRSTGAALCCADALGSYDDALRVQVHGVWFSVVLDIKRVIAAAASWATGSSSAI